MSKKNDNNYEEYDEENSGVPVSNASYAGLAGSMIGAVANTVNTIMGINAQRQQIQSNQRHEQEMMEKQWHYNETSANNADMRTRSLYNDLYSPQAKVQQLQQAGLNPALMYSAGGMSGTSSTSGAQAAPTNTQPYYPDAGLVSMTLMEGMKNMNSTLQTAINAMTSIAQTENLGSNTNLNEALADQARENIGVLKTSIEKIKQEKLTEEQRTKVTEAEAVIAEINKGWADAKNAAELGEMWARIDNLEADTTYKTLESDYKLETWEYQKDLLIKQALVFGSQQKLNEQQANWYVQTSKKIVKEMQEGGLIDKQASFYDAIAKMNEKELAEYDKRFQQQIETIERGQNFSLIGDGIQGLTNLVSGGNPLGRVLGRMFGLKDIFSGKK